MGIEDLALIKSIPAWWCWRHAIRRSARALSAQMLDAGPVYSCTGRPEVPVVYRTAPQELEIRKAVALRGGKDATIIACGLMVPLSPWRAAAELAKRGVECRVLDMHRERRSIARRCSPPRRDRRVVTAGHLLDGGLGSAVARLVAEGRRAAWRSSASGTPTPRASRKSCSTSTASPPRRSLAAVDHCRAGVDRRRMPRSAFEADAPGARPPQSRVGLSLSRSGALAQLAGSAGGDAAVDGETMPR